MLFPSMRAALLVALFLSLGTCTWYVSNHHHYDHDHDHDHDHDGDHDHH